MPLRHRLVRAPSARARFAYAALLAVSMGCSDSQSTPRAISVESASVTLSATYGAPPPGAFIQIHFAGKDLTVGTPPGADMPSWLTTSLAEIQDQDPSWRSTACWVAITTTTLAPGPHTTTLRFTTEKADATGSSWLDVPVTLTILDDLIPSLDHLTFTPNNGSIEKRRVQLSLATGASFAWTAEADPGLLLTSGSGTSETPLEVSYDWLKQLTPGATALNVRVSAALPGGTLTKSIPVTLDAGPHRIYAPRNGLALTSVPGTSKLSATIPLIDNAGITTGTWSASADQPWLTVDGPQGDAIAIHADPTGLADGLYFATVTVSSTGPGVEGPDRVRVGLYLSSVKPSQGLIANVGNRYELDPIRPWAWTYFYSDSTRVTAYDVYTGAIEKQLTLPASVKSIVISGDGATLYAGPLYKEDLQRWEDIARVAIDTEQTEILPWNDLWWSDALVTTFRPGGREYLVTNNASFLDTTTGTLTSGSSVFNEGLYWSLAVSADQRYLYGATSFYPGPPAETLQRARVTLSGPAAVLTLEDAGSTAFPQDTAGMGLAVTPDGSSVAAILDPDPGTPAAQSIFVFGPSQSGALVSTGSFVVGGAGDAPDGIAISPEGRVAAVAGQTTIDLFETLLGTLTNSYSLPSAQKDIWAVRFSGDGERVLVLSRIDDSTPALWVYPSR